MTQLLGFGLLMRRQLRFFMNFLLSYSLLVAHRIHLHFFTVV